MWCLVRRGPRLLPLLVGGGGVGRLPWLGVSWDGLRGGWWVVGALLGPEGTGMGGFSPLWVGSLLCVLSCGAGLLLYRFGVGGPLVGAVGVRGGWWCGVGVCLLFENCTVDASIFVAKFLRAHGGCLGTRSR